MHFPINMSGIGDSVENYQSYLVACCLLMVFGSYESFFFFFFFVLSFSISLMTLMLKYAFTHILSMRILLLAVENV